MASDKLRVYFTIDVETSMGGSWHNPAYEPLGLERTVFGKHESRFYGIPLIMDILEEQGFRGTFFTEVFSSYAVGQDERLKVFRMIRTRGHDAQLHLHPIFRFYRDRSAGRPARHLDLLHKLSLGEQREFIREGIGLFTGLSGQAPRAFRAGCYGASETTLQVLRENGILIDSSYNLTYLENSGFHIQPLNAPTIIDGVYEFPLTVFRVFGSNRYRMLEIGAVSVSEVVATIRRLQAAGCKDVVLSLHSFSFLKKADVRYHCCRPDYITIQRMRRLCRTLAALRDEIEVRSLGEIDLPLRPLAQPQVIPSMGFLHPTLRTVVQVINRVQWF
jgi:hypothetical protein